MRSIENDFIVPFGTKLSFGTHEVLAYEAGYPSGFPMEYACVSTLSKG